MCRIINGYYFADELSVVTYNIEYIKNIGSEKVVSANYTRKEFDVEPQTVFFLPYTDTVRTCNNQSAWKLLLEIRNRVTKKLLFRKIYRDGNCTIRSTTKTFSFGTVININNFRKFVHHINGRSEPAETSFFPETYNGIQWINSD